MDLFNPQPVILIKCIMELYHIALSLILGLIVCKLQAGIYGLLIYGKVVNGNGTGIKLQCDRPAFHLNSPAAEFPHLLIP
jgi:hypothetical protein